MAVRPPANSAKETMTPSEEKSLKVDGAGNKTYADAAKNKLKRERPEERRGSITGAKRSKVMPVKRTSESRSPSTDFDWNVDNEVMFLTAMMGHKPVGVNKHFEMVCILSKFQELLNRDVDSKVIWDRLDTMYNMERLNEAERIPFPNDESEFTLPDEEFSVLMKVKLEEIDLKVDEPIVEEVVVPEPKREQKRELQVYKGMKDIKKEVTKEVKTPAKTVEPVPSPAKEEKKEKKPEPEVKKPIVEKRLSKELKKGRPVTPAPSASTATPTARKERRQSGEKPAAVKGRPSLAAAKKEDKSELKKERVKELTPVAAKAKRSTRGSVTDSASNKSASPVTTANNKRKKKN